MMEEPGRSYNELASVMERLRAEDGCPWDLEQTPQSLCRHILEEAYETVDAIENEDWAHLAEELGDLLLQVVFQAQIASERGLFSLVDVTRGITEKLERRHPHIFGDEIVSCAEEVNENWERIKVEQEGKEAGVTVPRGLPAVSAARKIQGKAARSGFDWADAGGVYEKLQEEIDELKEADALRGAERKRRVEEELGDLLFTVVNLSRHLDVDPERALRMTSRGFVKRFELMLQEAERHDAVFAELDMEEKERLWQRAKKAHEGMKSGDPRRNE